MQLASIFSTSSHAAAKQCRGLSICWCWQLVIIRSRRAAILDFCFLCPWIKASPYRSRQIWQVISFLQYVCLVSVKILNDLVKMSLLTMVPKVAFTVLHIETTSVCVCNYNSGRFPHLGSSQKLWLPLLVVRRFDDDAAQRAPLCRRMWLRRLRRKHGRILYRRIPAALSLDVVGCAVGVCAGSGRHFKGGGTLKEAALRWPKINFWPFFWPPTERRPQESSLCSRRRGSLFPGILITWPSHLSCLLSIIVSRDVVHNENTTHIGDDDHSANLHFAPNISTNWPLFSASWTNFGFKYWAFVHPLQYEPPAAIGRRHFGICELSFDTSVNTGAQNAGATAHAGSSGISAKLDWNADDCVHKKSYNFFATVISTIPVKLLYFRKNHFNKDKILRWVVPC